MEITVKCGIDGQKINLKIFFETADHVTKISIRTPTEKDQKGFLSSFNERIVKSW